MPQRGQAAAGRLKKNLEKNFEKVGRDLVRKEKGLIFAIRLKKAVDFSSSFDVFGGIIGGFDDGVSGFYFSSFFKIKFGCLKKGFYLCTPNERRGSQKVL